MNKILIALFLTVSIQPTWAQSELPADKKFGNLLEFHALEGASHFIWFDPRYAGQVRQLRDDFLKKLGY